ncbi:MAG: SH3 domain-containing protein [Candidatus Promineifilaceae bacterium]
MIGTTWPIAAAVIGLILSYIAYRGIQRGGARYYQLERDAILRRAAFSLVGGISFFILSVGLLVYDRQQLTLIETEEEDATVVETAPTPVTTLEVAVENAPPTVEIPLIPTEDPNAPTPTPTRVIIRMQINGTAGSGVYLRGTPATTGEEIQVLDDLTILTILDDTDVVEGEGYTWMKVRTLGGTEGWVVDIFLEDFSQ